MLGDGIRRNIATISDEERTLFVNALLQLDDPTSAFFYPGNLGHEGADASGNITYWDMQEQIHKDAHVHGINVHFGPGFVPWHRVMVNRFEALLRKVDSRLSLHYWDWTTDPRVGSADWAVLLTPVSGSPVGFMGGSGASGGNPLGYAGPPFQNFESTEKSDTADGGDGIHDHIWRDVAAQAANADGTPSLPADSVLLLPTTFTAFVNGLKSAHDNVAHSYIGGTLKDPHFSFHDPFVFLLHSNLDRIWATWQRAPGHQDRLDPATAYGTIATDEGQPANYFDEWVQPWAGIVGETPNDPTNLNNGTPGTDLNPWKSDVSQQAHVPYNDPSVVIPASYDTAPHASYFVVNRDTFSTSEIDTGKLTYPNAFYLVYDGFTPKELGATPPGVPTNLPTFTFTGASHINTPQLAALNPVSYENPGVDVPQRILLSFDLQFADGSDFPLIAGDENFVGMQASLAYNVDTGTGGSVVPQTAVASTELVLVKQPNPYMIDVDPMAQNPSWLSVDTRVFQVKGPGPGGSPAAGSILGVTQGDMDADHNAPFTFIDGVLGALHASPLQFDNALIFPTDENASQLELSQKVGPPGMQQRVYNYAVAKVRYLAPGGGPPNEVDAQGVSVFFRVFSTMVSALDYDAFNVGGNGNYRRTSNVNGALPGSAVPLLGIENDALGNPETASIPFFASPRVRASSSDFNDGTGIASMTTQAPDSTNIQGISGTGSENVTFFGAWLDVNLAPGDPNYHEFPLNPAAANRDGGPFTVATQSIQQLMLNTHHCMVAEIFFWPPGTPSDPIPPLASPASSDRLAQRNLTLVRSGNPGYPATHTVQTTFIVKPSVITIDRPGNAAMQATVAPAAATAHKRASRGKQGAGAEAAVVTNRHRGPDELIVRWNNVPRTAEATFYMPEIQADEILKLSALRQHPTVLEKVDAHTLRCRLSDVTFIPLPSHKGTIAGLMSLTLPRGVRTGQVYKFSVEQYSGYTLKTLGAFQMTIPVRPDPEILPEEIRKLSVMRYIQLGIPTSSRWSRIFVRYIDQIAARVRGFGGDPDAVKPSPDGSGGEAPVCPPPCPEEVCSPPDLFGLNIPWKECDIEGELELKIRFKRKCK
jgi:hypothetical protein